MMIHVFSCNNRQKEPIESVRHTSAPAAYMQLCGVSQTEFAVGRRNRLRSANGEYPARFPKIGHITESPEPNGRIGFG